MKQTLAKRWYDLSTQELPREIGSIRPRDFDALPFGVFRIDRQGKVHDWTPDASHAEVIAGRIPPMNGRSIFSDVAPCFFIRSFREELSDLFLADGFDETFYFTLRFPGDWRQAAVRVVAEGTGLIDLIMTPLRMIRPERQKRPTVASGVEKGAGAA